MTEAKRKVNLVPYCNVLKNKQQLLEIPGRKVWVKHDKGESTKNLLFKFIYRKVACFTRGKYCDPHFWLNHTNLGCLLQWKLKFKVFAFGKGLITLQTVV